MSTVCDQTSSKLDVEKIRQDFPILAQKVNGKPLVYLDSAATSQKPREVLAALNHYYEFSNANVHRGLHVLAERATTIYEGAREKVGKFIHAARPEEIVWTKNATESLNLVAHGYGRKFLSAGDEIVVSLMEHHSNLVPWQLLAQNKGCRVRAVGLNPDGTLKLDELERLLASGKVKVVALTHVSNVLGTINPIAEISRKVHVAGAVFVVDGCQAAPHLPVDVRALGADFYAFSSHKMCGPTGLGILYGRYDLLDKMDPFLGGGEMIEEVHVESSTYKEPPWRFEAGTPPIAETAGLSAAVDYLERVGVANIRAHEKALLAYALKKMADVKGVKIFGPRDIELRSGVIAFELDDLHAHDVAQVLDSEGVAVRAGHHCTQPLHNWLKADATARLSVYLYNTERDIDTLVAALGKVRETFEAGMTMPGTQKLSDTAAVPGAKTHHEEQGLDSLYRDVIFEHYRRPHNRGAIPGAEIVTKGNNPVCGDRITVYGKVGADGKLEQIGFEGKGCAICIASSSMMTEAVRHKSLDDAGKLGDRFKAMMRNETPFEVPPESPDLEALEGVRKFSVRVKCATLAWTTLKNGIVAYQAGHRGETSKDESCAT